MKTSVEHVDETKVKLTITVEAERVGKALDQAASRLASEVKVPGFRPGKAPRRVIESRLGTDALVEEALRESLPDFYAEAARSEDLAVVGPPEFGVNAFTAGQDAEFTATVEVMPEVEVPDYVGLQVPHPEWELTDEEVQAEIDQLRERFAELVTAERPAEVGDQVLISVTGMRDGEPLAEASAEDVVYAVRDPEVSDSELDRQLVGAEAGGIVKFTDRLGSDFGELGDAECDFTVILKEVKAKRLPDVDDDFAAKASEYDTAEELWAGLREQMGEEKLTRARRSLRGQVVEAVADRVEVVLPEALVQQELRLRINRLAKQAERFGMDVDSLLAASGADPEQVVASYKEEARRAVRAQLVIDAVGRQAGIEVTAEDLESEVRRQAERLEYDPKVLVEQMAQNSEHMAALYSDAMRRKAIDHLVEQVEVLSSPPPEEAEAADSVGGDEPTLSEQAAAPDATPAAGADGDEDADTKDSQGA